MTRLRQVAILVAGALTASAMTVLGVWQFRVYESQGAEAAAQRAAETPVPLQDVARPGDAVRAYGRSVVVEGQYLADQQLLVPNRDTASPARVLTALQQSDGSVIAVVRGVVASPTAPPPPPGQVQVVGVLLPSEESGTSVAGDLDSIRAPILAQRWPQPMIDGFVTLSAASATAEGLQPAVPRLPEGRGRLRNGAYALQWWIFAAFAIGLALRMAHDLGRRELLSEDATVPPHE